MLEWGKRTPFGSLVLPEVYWIIAGSSGRMMRSGAEVFVLVNFSTVVTSWRLGTKGRRSMASPSTRWKVIRMEDWALRRITAWRLAYSSNRSARYGG